MQAVTAATPSWPSRTLPNTTSITAVTDLPPRVRLCRWMSHGLSLHRGRRALPHQPEPGIQTSPPPLVPRLLEARCRRPVGSMRRGGQVRHAGPATGPDPVRAACSFVRPGVPPRRTLHEELSACRTSLRPAQLDCPGLPRCSGCPQPRKARRAVWHVAEYGNSAVPALAWRISSGIETCSPWSSGSFRTDSLYRPCHLNHGCCA